MTIRLIHDVLERAKDFTLEIHSKLSGPRMCASTCVTPKGGEGHGMATCRITESTILMQFFKNARVFLKIMIGVVSWITTLFQRTLL